MDRRPETLYPLSTAHHADNCCMCVYPRANDVRWVLSEWKAQTLPRNKTHFDLTENAWQSCVSTSKRLTGNQKFLWHFRFFNNLEGWLQEGVGGGGLNQTTEHTKEEKIGEQGQSWQGITLFFRHRVHVLVTSSLALRHPVRKSDRWGQETGRKMKANMSRLQENWVGTKEIDDR